MGAQIVQIHIPGCCGREDSDDKLTNKEINIEASGSYRNISHDDDIEDVAHANEDEFEKTPETPNSLISPLSPLHDEGAPQEKKPHTPIMDGYHETTKTTSVVRLRLEIPDEAFGSPRKVNKEKDLIDEMLADVLKTHQMSVSDMVGDSVENDSDCMYRKDKKGNVDGKGMANEDDVNQEKNNVSNLVASTIDNDVDDTDEMLFNKRSK
eukprot:96139_1